MFGCCLKFCLYFYFCTQHIIKRYCIVLFQIILFAYCKVLCMQLIQDKLLNTNQAEFLKIKLSHNGRQNNDNQTYDAFETLKRNCHFKFNDGGQNSQLFDSLKQAESNRQTRTHIERDRQTDRQTDVRLDRLPRQPGVTFITRRQRSSHHIRVAPHIETEIPTPPRYIRSIYGVCVTNC